MMRRGDLSESDVLLCGLAYTSRTETLEDYLKDKTKSLVVIALSSCFLKENLSSCRLYDYGILKRKFKVPVFRIKDYKWYRQPLVLLVFFVYWASICFSLIKLKKRYDIYIGVSHSFGLWGAVLKKFKVVRHLIYYCIDYYIPPKKINFNTLFIKLINFIDRFTVRNADYIWDISPNISSYRWQIGKIPIDSYKNTIVPLGYSRHLRRFKSIDKIERWNIGFVGSITPNQGLQLLVETMPQLLQEFPKAKVVVIGQGPFLSELKNMVSQRGLNEYFRFLGFIKDEDKMLDILSGCAIAVALYSDSIDNKNIICADPGKPKLYALCGLPIITTKSCSLTEEIINNKAGIIVNYEKDDLRNAISYLMGSAERLKAFRINSFRLGEEFVSNKIFNDAVDNLKLS